MFEDHPIDDVVVEQLAPGLHVVRLPLPVRLDAVNCYVGVGDDGRATIIDAGLAFGAAAVWGEALARLGIEPTDVERIVVTHFHPDHIGGAGALAELCDAPVLASAVTAEQSPPVWGDGLEQRFAEICDHLVEHGMPAARVASLRNEPLAARAAVQLPASFELLVDGDELTFSGTSWEVVLTPGHADGHLCLHDREGRRLLAGDHLLERISPAVGLFPHNSLNPLRSYLDSLRRTAQLSVDEVLPGHGLPFTGAAERCDALLAHHQQRIDQCLAELEAGPRTAHEVALGVFGDQHDPANERFAVTETLAHLEHERALARVTRERARARASSWRYALA